MGQQSRAKTARRARGAARQIITRASFMEEHRKAALGGAYRALELGRRVPELMKQRGWGADEDLAAVISTAIACMAYGAGATVIRRPPAADMLKGLWPVENPKSTAKAIFDTLELDDLLQRR